MKSSISNSFGFAAFLCSLLALNLAASPSISPPTLLIVIGAPGDAEFATNFLRQASLWETAGSKAQSPRITIGRDAAGETNDLDLIRSTLASEPKDTADPLWIVLIGHGTFDGKAARFNLRGPDVSADDFAQWLQPFHRPLAIIDTSSSSAPFLARLSGTNRVIITATRSGHEQNYARFGSYFAEAISSHDADLDKDGQVSLLEAFLIASRKTAEFYKLEGRLATEHALLDDNGDGLGTPADWFRGLRAVKRAKENAGVDGLLARQFILNPAPRDARLSADQRARRDALEREVFLLRDRKSELDQKDYYHRLEALLLDLAKVYYSDAKVSAAGASAE